MKPEPAAEPRTAGIISTNDMVTEKYSVSDRDLVQRFASDEELKPLADEIRLRRAAPPKSWPWVCPSCRWSAEYGDDTAGPVCLQCGAIEDAHAADERQGGEGLPREAGGRAQGISHPAVEGRARAAEPDRARSGLAPLTIDEYREEQAELARRVR